jgi:hypothetical protein
MMLGTCIYWNPMNGNSAGSALPNWAARQCQKAIDDAGAAKWGAGKAGGVKATLNLWFPAR